MQLVKPSSIDKRLDNYQVLLDEFIDEAVDVLNDHVGVDLTQEESLSRVKIMDSIANMISAFALIESIK